MDRVIAIQHLRAVAAFSVLVFHALESTTHRFIVGAAGVDLFFVISGFVMGLLLADPAARPASFLQRRFLRVAPFYWLATFLTAGLWVLRPDLFPWMDVTAPDLLRSLLFVPYVAAHGSSPVLLQGWTLTYEAAFYVLCAAALFAAPARRLPLVAACLLAVGALPAVIAPQGVIAATLVNPLVVEFAAGLGLALAWRRGWFTSALWGASALVAGLIWFAVAQINGIDPAGYARLAWWGAPAVLIVAGALAVEGAGRLPHLPGGAALGDASYALYLLHPIPLATSVALLPAATPHAIRIPLAIAAAVLLALTAHRFIERPFLAAMRGRRGSTRRQGGASAGEAAVAASLLPIAKPQRRH